nr:glycosyltransferase [Bacteroidota bacterium]
MPRSIKELVSVIIPTYNCAHTITRALESVYSQNYPHLEIIVIDDGSTDNIQKILQKFPDLKIITFSSQRGVASARNAGIGKASGEFVAFLDADDKWFPQKITKQVALMKNSPLQPGLVTCNSESVGANKKYEACSNYYELRKPYRGSDCWYELLKANFIPTPTVMVKKSVFQVVSPFNESYKISEDLDLWARIAFNFPIDYVDEVLVRFYDRPGSLMDRLSNNRHTQTLEVLQNIFLENRKEISRKQEREIMGTRYLMIAYSSYVNGEYAMSLEFCMKVLYCRHRIIKTLSVIFRCLLKRAKLS